MLLQNFAGEFPIDDFLEKYVPKPDSEVPKTIDNIVSQASRKLTAAEKQLKNATNENAMSKPLRNYLKTVVSSFPAENKPLFEDTCHKTFPSLDEGDHYTRPDITGTRPGVKKAPKEWRWSHAGVVIELKWKIDFINAQGQLDQAEGRRHAAVQLAKSARSLLMATGSCHVYVVAVFKVDVVRIFRFDRTGFRASAPFNWLKAPNIFPTFFYRLYNPGTAGRMAGEDDTITTPTANEKTEMYNALCKNPFYKDLYPSQEEATDESLWIKAVRFEPGTRVPQVVSCFTIGPILSHTDGLFSRATRVFRVILQEDADTASPIIYALKDAWRQECRRPEIDYYDVIAKYCANEADNVDAVVSAAMKSMAKCHGSVDLSIVGREPAIPGHNPLLHKTSSATGNNFERRHMRTLITPVGAPLRGFKSTKALVQALNSAVLHHRIAYDAGVLHRDVSEGNVLFEEAVAVQKQGFLVDWDYAEFTAAGLANFKAWFPERQAENNTYTNIDKSLKDMTGTLPFMAIAIIENTTTHDAHHDLESFYWLLSWMILRHTRHTHPDGRLGCSKVFDPSGSGAKLGFLHRYTPLAESALFRLAEQLRNGTVDQNPIQRTAKRLPPGNNAATAPTTTNATDPLTYEFVLYSFLEAIESEDWPTPDDPALKFVVPSLDDKSQSVNLLKETLRKETHRASGSGIKRSRQPEDDPLPFASTSIRGTTAAASSEEPKSKKARKTKAPQPAETGEGVPERRKSQRNRGKGKGKVDSA
ncbi:hypothetical protein B0H11DRAFT_1873602 [Mycena galericulata]|nr:hypothetical protein B0H11DRAFT_1873602 [Mycena galericulata]